MTPLEILRRQFRELDAPTEKPRWPDSPTLCGIYVLVDHHEIVYIGSSVDVLNRVWAHRRNRTFDRLLWLRLPAAVHHHYEGAFIRAIRPRLNRSAPIDARYDAEILEGFGLEACLEWWTPPPAERAPRPDIATRIAHWLTDRGITQAELGSRVGVSKTSVSYWETGASAPTAGNILRIATALGLEMSEFYAVLS